jgi:hypothetical protein
MCDVEACQTISVESIALDNDVEFVHEFEPLLSRTVREGLMYNLYESLSLLKRVTLFIGRIILDFMTDTVFV